MPLHRIKSVSKLLFQCNRYYCLAFPKQHDLSSRRFIMTYPPMYAKKALKQEKEKFRTYVIQQYLDYLSNYAKVLEQRFPSAMKMYRVFSVGIKDFYKDLKTYLSLRIRLARDQGFQNMSRQELELYVKMPGDMLRIAPVLILSAIPFGNYIIFPLAFLKPRALLCSHFWSIQQKAEFSVIELKERLRHNRPTFRALQAKLESIPDVVMKEKFRKIIAMLGSGVHPSAEEIIACKLLFSQGPYHLSNLSYSHCGHLIQIHGLRKSVFRQSKLKYRAFLLLEMDKAIIKEGGVASLSTDALRHACHLRGLHSSHLTNSDMILWLEQWLVISERVDKSCYSLILHCPLFLAYNHPQNWMLIY
ncbi:hypothetical protein JYU34_000582 [Plutella xylostella]|uniref:Letm1 RBD domain-containing protein n=1 Tax=Plutella xylostella TaxID=51655 RepID=A0ABQ7R821_PLUXY|nr:LETM1 domain-containing protein 1 [Plutella xylostella]KAG7313457.1 hypothetical protein JYU34_000582 [Plutella xylostella]